MKYTIKKDMKSRARLTKGFVNLLKDDVDYICKDADRYDLFNISDSIYEAKRTTMKIMENLEVLENIVDMSREE